MEITKIGNFTAEEFEALKKAGTILGGVAKALEAGEITVLAEDSNDLIKALVEVLSRI